MPLKTMHIGLDDTDSTRKGCTTYIAALIVEKLQKMQNLQFIDYPNLIRLNPNIPWKTRGNGALCIRIKHHDFLEDLIMETVIELVEKIADLSWEGTDPGIVFFKTAKIPREIQVFSKNAVTGVVRLKTALQLLKKFGVEAFGFKKGRGIIGSLAAIGETLQSDHTYELIAYRLPKNYGSRRLVDSASIFEMDRVTDHSTFNNVDYDKKRVIITPRGPDPILFGIRGEHPDILKRAFNMVTVLEPVERWLIFRSNQGTDAHLKQYFKLSEIQAHHPVIVRGTVVTSPKIVPKRHVIFSIADESGRVDCAAYEPTGSLRHIARKLIRGDCLDVFGGVRASSESHPLTINLEKIHILHLAPKIVQQNPNCPKCQKRLKSMGQNQGFRCKHCGLRHRDLRKNEVAVKRSLRKGLYITSPRSQRHLTKPLRRYGLEKRHGLFQTPISGWYALSQPTISEND
ncbi:MAG: DUF1743 domain-containing protein [Candidatus Hodarchaeota archaeon]